jgi:SAM-dependent methyltransferase
MKRRRGTIAEPQPSSVPRQVIDVRCPDQSATEPPVVARRTALSDANVRVMAPSLGSAWARLLAVLGRSARALPMLARRVNRFNGQSVAAQSVVRSRNGRDLPLERPVPLPPGLDLPSIEAMFRSYSVNDEPQGHLDAYVQDSLWRFLHTWGLVRHERGQCLEIGANPYFTTLLLDDYTDLALTLTNYYSETRSETTSETLRYRDANGEAVEKAFTSHLVNVERDPFPFEDDAFDVVLFCEVIEHLLMDPLFALHEINRVLRPGGRLLVTTPNVIRLQNVMNMTAGVNIYDPYSGYGPYGRHNREYNRLELTRLLDFAGFDVELSFTADGHPSTAHFDQRYKDVLPLVRFREHDLGHYLFIRARLTRQPREGLPAFLYRSWPPGMIVEEGG